MAKNFRRFAVRWKLLASDSSKKMVAGLGYACVRRIRKEGANSAPAVVHEEAGRDLS